MNVRLLAALVVLLVFIGGPAWSQQPNTPQAIGLAGDLTLAPQIVVEGSSLPQVLYVSATTGADGNPGTAALPLRTLSSAILAAAAAGPPYPMALVATGTYSEGFNLQIPMSIVGGFNPATWQPSAQRSTIKSPGATAQIGNILQPATLARLDFRSSGTSGSSNSSIALTVSSSSAITFSSCSFVAANGGTGIPGAAGPAGQNGSAGGQGFDAFGPNPNGGAAGPSPIGNSGGAGGSGPGPVTVGTPGGLAPNGGGQGGAGGCPVGLTCAGYNFTRGWFFTWGEPGDAGASGVDGPNGAPAATAGQIVSGVWVPSSAGTGGSGTHGKGGGGGGAGTVNNGNCSFFVGGGGGGGGGGARAGGGGLGGSGGGASLGILLIDSSPTFHSCSFVSGLGGKGGNGGTGAVGGTGGPGGAQGGTLQATCFPPTTTSDHGGTGGHGGNAGSGGGGGGGAGGPSYCIYRVGTSAPVLTSPTYSPGPGGAGGLGGSHGNPVLPHAQSGAAGPSGTVF